MKAFVTVLLLSALSFAQTVTTSELHVKNTSPAVPQVSRAVLYPSIPGTRTLYYWIVSIDANGNKSLPSGGFRIDNAATTLSTRFANNISWQIVNGVNSYDVLRTTSATMPTGVCNCAVATNVLGSSIKDVSETLNAYTVGTGNADFITTNEVQNGAVRQLTRYNGAIVNTLNSDGTGPLPSGILNVADFGAVASPVGGPYVDATAAFQAAHDRLANGGTIYIPYSTNIYIVNNLTVNKSVRFVCVGVPAWGSNTTQEPCRIGPNTNGAVAFHGVSPSGNTTILQTGPQFDNIACKDMTNSGAGGSAAGCYLFEGVNHGSINHLSCEDFSTGYCATWDGTNAGDSSYWTVIDPRIRNTLFGIIHKNFGAAGFVIVGGEIVCSLSGSICIDAPTYTGNTNTMFLEGTSIEVGSNDIGLRLATRQANINARFEALTSSTGAIGVQLLATAANNKISGSFNKFIGGTATPVDIQAGATDNVIDYSNHLNSNGVNDAGNGTVLLEGGRGLLSASFQNSNRVVTGSRSMRDASNTIGAAYFLGAGNNIFRDSRKLSYVSQAVCDGAGNITATVPVVNNFVVGDAVTYDQPALESPNYAVAFATVSAITGTTVTFPKAACTAGTSYGGYLYQAGGLGISAKDSASSTICTGSFGSGIGTNNQTATSVASSCISQTGGTVTMTSNTGLTVGTAFTPTVIATWTATNGGQLTINSTTAPIKTPNFHSTTGTNFLCVDTAGNITKSTTACSGT